MKTLSFDLSVTLPSVIRHPQPLDFSDPMLRLVWDPLLLTRPLSLYPTPIATGLHMCVPLLPLPHPQGHTLAVTPQATAAILSPIFTPRRI
ncbi:MAG: hypothetical protein V3V23_01645 [Dehalococcoidales bacterium]